MTRRAPRKEARIGKADGPLGGAAQVTHETARLATEDSQRAGSSDGHCAEDLGGHFKEMRRSTLTGTTSGIFDSLKCRYPPLSGPYVEVTSLSGGGAAYDDSALQVAVAANGAAISLKRDISTSYSQAQIDVAILGREPTITLATSRALVSNPREGSRE